jgi:predicted carbohydrate-binding protein with CBM5 and CBM33 domain
MLTVKNGNDFNFTGRYDGVDYSFPSGAVTAVPDDAAKHIFGVGLPDKADILVRHGWMTQSNRLNEALSILNKFSFNIADQLEAGEIISPEVAVELEQEQGSAPLQTGSAVDVNVPDGTIASAAQPTPSGGSILDTFKSFVGG